jgi:hypothetical protein
MSHSSRGHLAQVGRLVVLLALVLVLIAGSTISVSAVVITFQGTECITRQEATQVSITIVPNANITLYYEYGTTSGVYTNQTTQTTATNGTPKTVVISSLTANTKYYYRLRYSTTGGAPWETRPEKSFRTARAAGSTFTFDITSDAHVNILMGSASTWTSTLNDVAADQPDFVIDLGDTVAMRSVSPNDAAGATAAYTYTLPFFNIVSGASGLYLVKGNHEQTEGWHLQGTLSGSLPVIGTNAQKKYYPMPVPDAFYGGNSSTYSSLTGDQLREDYYSWTWGDALFVVIDPYWYTSSRPYVSDPGGGETDTTGTGDAWDWTLGQTQFNWLKTTLTNSTAKYKFIFTHQMTTDGNVNEDYGQTSANDLQYVEWGGYNENGTYGWNTERAGWGTEPVHQVISDTHVSAVFKGHDHQYAYEKRDGVVYQTVPVAGWGAGGNGFGMYTTGDGYTIRALTNCGHLRVTVGPSQTTVDYIRTGESSPTTNGTYTILPATAPTGQLGNANGDGAVNSTDALIILSADVGINTSTFCPMNCGDVNADGLVNSTDALIILSYDVGIPVGFPVGTGACPSSITQPPGCGS